MGAGALERAAMSSEHGAPDLKRGLASVAKVQDFLGSVSVPTLVLHRRGRSGSQLNLARKDSRQHSEGEAWSNSTAAITGPPAAEVY